MSEILNPPIEEEKKFCINCSHLLGNRQYSENWQNWKCSKTKQEDGINLVTGEMIFKTSYCENIRKSEIACGPQGKWYEEYEKPLDLYGEDNRAAHAALMPKKSKRITEDDLANL